jgi:hypothetical protein
MTKKIIPIRIDAELYDRFYAKYRKNSAERIRELIAKDLQESG